VKRPSTPPDMRLRCVYPEDHEWLVELHNDPVVLHNLTDPRPITLESHMKWWSTIEKNPKEDRLIFVKDSVDGNMGTPVGFAKFYSIDTYNGTCVLGADIHKDFRGQGLAKYMWSRMLDYAFGSYGLMLQRASLTTATYNVIGQKVYNHIGFKEEGRLVHSLMRDGKYYDQICMYALRSDWHLAEIMK